MGLSSPSPVTFELGQFQPDLPEGQRLCREYFNCRYWGQAKGKSLSGAQGEAGARLPQSCLELSFAWGEQKSRKSRCAATTMMEMCFLLSRTRPWGWDPLGRVPGCASQGQEHPCCRVAPPDLGCSQHVGPFVLGAGRGQGAEGLCCFPEQGRQLHLSRRKRSK